jgi:hypothetical protein
MELQELKSIRCVGFLTDIICRVGYVTEILSKDQVEVTLDTEDGIQKIIYTIHNHDLKEGIKVGERIYLSTLQD